ncbi:MAG: GTP cyclohydrolase II [Candidatus Poseidoniaceae archaeon]|jgi:GTP cyclohydrolase II|tara:strand:+ start:694 stop:1332 length:639 start_codon:yes stop_codon:yes gene_type:complete
MNVRNDDGSIKLIESDDVPSEAKLPTEFGDFLIRVFHEESTGLDHVALSLGDLRGPDPVLIRVHSECLTGDAFGSLRCDCGPQLQAALLAIAERGWGCLLYLRQEGRGIGLHAKIQAYHLQDQGADTLDANLMLGLPVDSRDYTIASGMLSALAISEVSLLTNNPNKVEQLRSHQINVIEMVPLIVGVGEHNRDYLQTKGQRMGHNIKPSDL